MGQRLNIIILAEGAIDQEGKAITPDYVKDVSCRQIRLQIFVQTKYLPFCAFCV